MTFSAGHSIDNWLSYEKIVWTHQPTWKTIYLPKDIEEILAEHPIVQDAQVSGSFWFHLQRSASLTHLNWKKCALGFALNHKLIDSRWNWEFYPFFSFSKDKIKVPAFLCYSVSDKRRGSKAKLFPTFRFWLHSLPIFSVFKCLQEAVKDLRRSFSRNDE